MENIVLLDEYRKRRRPVRRPATSSRVDHASDPTGAQYFCTRCDSDEFRLSALGMVHCAHCNALMRNLLVSPGPNREAS